MGGGGVANSSNNSISNNNNSNNNTNNNRNSNSNSKSTNKNGIMEKKMETTGIMGGVRDLRFRVLQVQG